MTDSSVTQCPHCRTSFRVSRAQLGAAHGSVRCGACLHVFKATEHLLGETPAKAAPSAPAITAPAIRSPHMVASSKPSTQSTALSQPATSAKIDEPQTAKPAQVSDKSSLDTMWIHDDLDLDGLDLDEELARLEQEEQQFSREFIALQSAPKPAEQLLQAEPAIRSKHDESWAERLLDEPSQKAQPSAKPAVAIPEPQLSTDTATSTATKSADETPEKTEAEDSADDEETLEEIELAAAPDAAEHVRYQPEPLFQLHDEPVQLSWQAPQKPWGRWLGWGLLNLLAAAALAGQHINYRFDELARQDQYRPWFEQLCPMFGCSLPSKVDISQVKSSNLVVRSHPEFSGALVVDAIIYNRAPFSQPFPLLELRFADINGKPLANRRFKPSEYLSGELAGRREMPPQTPIHVSLDILDPGPKAVNYSLEFESPE